MKKYNRRILTAVVFVGLIMSLCGCWDLKDINDKLIVTALCFDVKDDEVWFYLEIANTEVGSASEKQSVEGTIDKFITYKSHGKTILEARDNLDEQLDKPLYLSGARTLVFTEKFADEYLIEYLYRFRSDETYRKQSICVITKDDPDVLLKKTHELRESFGIYIEGEFKTLDELGEFFPRTSGRIVENLSGDYSGILIPCVGIEDDLPSIIGYSVVKGSEVAGFIPMADPRIHGLYFLKADKAQIFYSVPYHDINFTVEAELTKRKIEPSYSEGQISMNLKFDISGELMYGDKKTPYNLKDEDMVNMSAIFTDIIKKDITDAVEQAQKEFNCDYLQFDDTFRINYPDEFESMAWDEQFSNISTSVDVKANISAHLGLDYGPNEAG